MIDHSYSMLHWFNLYWRKNIEITVQQQAPAITPEVMDLSQVERRAVKDLLTLKDRWSRGKYYQDH